MAFEELRQSAMMSHLLEAMDRGEDIGHYGRLVFVMVGRFFLSNDELKQQLMKDKDCNEQKAELLIRQVEAKGYNPPKRDRVIEWMNQQDFAICENSENPDSCNIYKEIKFPPEVYEKISSYYESHN
ncbi:MAG: hypothetical protein M3Y24_04190 [Acidobacteriota bacterium]|nr:hypothetical protein [Acidobacteriota bacterium]